MKFKVLSLLLCFVLVLTIFSGCGSSNNEETASEQATTENQVTTEQQSDSSNNNSSSEATSTESKSKEKKKVVTILENDSPYKVEQHKNVMDALAKAGYANGQGADITEIKLGNDDKKCPQAVEQIKQLKPDVVVVTGERFFLDGIVKPLEGSGIPVVIGDSAEGFVDESGKPKQNITGVRTMPQDMQSRAFSFLNQVAPANGKKAVFVTTPGMFKKEDVANSLKSVNVELKDYCEVNDFEGFKAAVEKYNADSEVGWVLNGLWPGNKKDGSAWSVVDTGKWEQANRKKPSVTYWAIAVQLGIPCGLGVDVIEMGKQAGEMAGKILDGEKIENMKAENPRKVNIVLNQKAAEDIKLTFSPEILGSASQVFIDYEGHTK